VRQEDSEGVWGQEDEDSDDAEQEKHEDLESLDQEHHGGFVDDEGGEGNGSAAGSVSRHRRFRRSHIVAPPIAPHPDNRVLIIPFSDG
jgi:hypothetical protein